jgi:spore germination protein
VNNEVQTSREAVNPHEISQSLQENIVNIRGLLGNPEDIIIRELMIDNTNHPCAIICLDGLADPLLVHDQILRQIQLMITAAGKQVPSDPDQMIAMLFDQVVSVADMKKNPSFSEMVTGILSGDTALLVEGTSQSILIDSKGWKSRQVEEPLSEGLVRGPRDGFTENIRDNTVRIRRRIKDHHLRLDMLQAGRRSKTYMVIAYLQDIADPLLVAEIKRRITSIDVDEIAETGFIEQWMEDDFLSPFPQALSTERPDRVVSSLYQGRVAVIVDGTPMVLIVPIMLSLMLHSPEDYYERWIVGTLARSLRLLATFLAVFSPSIYIALVTFHPGMIPSELAFSIAATRDGVPFPAFVEALLMVITMELLQEAGLRLPRPIGQTVGIVGGLVIGESAVSAGVVSPVMVIVISLTAIASFAIPTYSLALALRIIRFFTMIAAAIFGLYGVVLSLIVIMIHLSNLTSLGYPYLSQPQLPKDWKDLILRAPVTFLKQRPRSVKTKDQTRMRTGDPS